MLQSFRTALTRRARSARRLRPGARLASLVFALAAALLLPGCPDSPVCVFGGNCNGSGAGGIGVNPATIPTDGVTLEAALPRITAVFPSGTGADKNTPIVIVFSESMSPTNSNIAFDLAASGVGGGTLPFGVTSLIAEGRVLVLLPLTPLIANTTFQVRFRTGVSFQDLTGQVITQPADRVVGTFTTAATDAAVPELLTTWPVDAATDQSATGEILAIFTRAVSPATVTDASFAVTVNGVAPAFDPVAQPLTANGGLVTDTRVYRYRSVNAAGVPVPFANSGLVRVALSPTGSPIRDTASNALAPVEFDFRTAAFGAPASAVLTSAPNDAIGIDQITGPANLAVLVSTPDGQDGDQLQITIFGTQVTTEMNPPVIALQRNVALESPFTSFTLAASDLDLASGSHGIVADGPVGIAIQLKRGARVSPVRMLDTDLITAGVQSPVLDTIAPTLTGLGTSGTAVGSFRSDLRDLTIVGRASEPLRSVLVVTPSNGDNDFAADGFPPVAGAHRTGLFVAAPVPLGQLAAQQAVSYDVTIFDRALNSGGTASGTFRQVGASGPGVALPGGTLQVEVFDETTLAAISGAAVFTHENVGGVVTSVANALTASNGVASLAAAPAGETIVTVFVNGYDLFTFDGVPTDRLSVPLHATTLGNAGTSGSVTTTIAQINLFTRGFTDTRTLTFADRIAPVAACSFDQTQSRFECPFGPLAVRSREIGAQSALAVQVPANIFLYSPLTFLQGFELALPVPAVEPGATQTNDVAVGVLLSDATTDPEERAIDGPPLVLSTVNYPQLTGSPRVTVEAVGAGVRANPVVGQGVAFDLMPPSTNWAVRAAYPGAVDGIPDVMTDVLGRFVVSHTIDPDLMVRVECVESTGTRGGVRPRLSTGPVSLTPPAPSVLDFIVPIALNPSGEAYDVTFVDVLPDAVGEPGLYRVTITDLSGRAWTIWRSDMLDTIDSVATVHLPFIGTGATFPLTPGDLSSQISAFAWPTLDPASFLWTDVEREFELYSHSLSETLTPP